MQAFGQIRAAVGLSWNSQAGKCWKSTGKRGKWSIAFVYDASWSGHITYVSMSEIAEFASQRLAGGKRKHRCGLPATGPCRDVPSSSSGDVKVVGGAARSVNIGVFSVHPVSFVTTGVVHGPADDVRIIV